MEKYLVQNKKAVAKIICTTGDQRNPSNAFEAATALKEVIKAITECDIDIVMPDAAASDEAKVIIAVTGDGTDDALDLQKDAFSVTVKDGEVKILAGNALGIWNATAYFTSAVLGYEPYAGEMPAAKDDIKLPESFSYAFDGTPAPQPLMDVEPDGAFKVSMCGSTFYEELLRHSAFIYPENPIVCFHDGVYRERIIRKALAEQRLVWNTAGECSCEYCRHQKEESGKITHGFCECSVCSADAEREETPYGAYFDLVRETAERLEKIDPSAYLTIVATGGTLEPPKTYLGDNVRVVVCDRILCSAHPIADDSCERNAAFAKKLRTWKTLCGSLFVIDFTSDYYYFPATFPTLDIMRQNVSFYHEIGVDGVYMQFDKMQSELEFSDLRMILAEALMKRPVMSAEEYSERIDNALAHIYGTDAAEAVRHYIDRFTELAHDGHCFDTYSRPRDILSVKKKDGEGYDLSFACEAYKLWESVHPHPEKLARNELYLARMLFTCYQAQPVSYSKTQYSEWLMNAIDMTDRARALDIIMAD